MVVFSISTVQLWLQVLRNIRVNQAFTCMKIKLLGFFFSCERRRFKVYVSVLCLWCSAMERVDGLSKLALRHSGLQPTQPLMELEEVEVTARGTAGAWRWSQLAGGKQEEVTSNSSLRQQISCLVGIQSFATVHGKCLMFALKCVCLEYKSVSISRQLQRPGYHLNCRVLIRSSYMFHQVL